MELPDTPTTSTPPKWGLIIVLAVVGALAVMVGCSAAIMWLVLHAHVVITP